MKNKYFLDAWPYKQQGLYLLVLKSKRPTDVNQRAKRIVDIATGEVTESKEDIDLIKAAASSLGRKGELKGGNARATKLSPKRRCDIAKKAPLTRWNKKDTK